MEDAQIREIVTTVSERMRAARDTSVFAVWADGSITEHGLGFRDRKNPNGEREEPVATFVSGARLSPDKIRARILRGLESRH